MNKGINEFVSKFVADLTDMIEQSTKETLHATLAGALGDLPVARKSVPGNQRNYKRKQCPFPDCKEVGAPRYSQFCIAHGKELQAKGPEEFEKLKAEYWAEAQKPGGVWYEEKRAPQKRGRKPKVQTAAA